MCYSQNALQETCRGLRALLPILVCTAPRQNLNLLTSVTPVVCFTMREKSMHCPWTWNSSGSKLLSAPPCPQKARPAKAVKTRRPEPKGMRMQEQYFQLQPRGRRSLKSSMSWRVDFAVELASQKNRGFGMSSLAHSTPTHQLGAQKARASRARTELLLASVPQPQPWPWLPARRCLL